MRGSDELPKNCFLVFCFVFLFLVCESIRNWHPLTELFQNSHPEPEPWRMMMIFNFHISFLFHFSLFLCVVSHFHSTLFSSRRDTEPRMNFDVKFHRCSLSFVLLSWDYTNLTLHKFMIIRVIFVIVNCDVRAPTTSIVAVVRSWSPIELWTAQWHHRHRHILLNK